MIKGTSLLIGIVAMVLSTTVVGCNPGGDPVKAPPADSKPVPGGVAPPGTDPNKAPKVTPNGNKKGGIGPPPA